MYLRTHEKPHEVLIACKAVRRARPAFSNRRTSMCMQRKYFSDMCNENILRAGESITCYTTCYPPKEQSASIPLLLMRYPAAHLGICRGGALGLPPYGSLNLKALRNTNPTSTCSGWSLTRIVIFGFFAET